MSARARRRAPSPARPAGPATRSRSGFCRREPGGRDEQSVCDSDQCAEDVAVAVEHAPGLRVRDGKSASSSFEMQRHGGSRVADAKRPSERGHALALFSEPPARVRVARSRFPRGRSGANPPGLLSGHGADRVARRRSRSARSLVEQRLANRRFVSGRQRNESTLRIIGDAELLSGDGLPWPSRLAGTPRHAARNPIDPPVPQIPRAPDPRQTDEQD